MVLCDINCLNYISNYLEVPGQKFHMTENNVLAATNLLPKKNVEGFSTIVQELLLRSKLKNTLDGDQLKKALCRQWLEYAAICINYADISTNRRQVLQEINTELRVIPYITGTTKSVADVALFYALHPVMSKLPHQDKAEFVNVSRWFDHLQQDTKLRNNLQLINFSVTLLYL